MESLIYTGEFLKVLPSTITQAEKVKYGHFRRVSLGLDVKITIQNDVNIKELKSERDVEVAIQGQIVCENKDVKVKELKREKQQIQIKQLTIREGF